MATIEQSVDSTDKLEQFVFRAVDEVGATLNAALVVMGTSSASTAPWPARAR